MTRALPAGFLVVAALILLPLGRHASAQQADDALLKHFNWRSVGPAGAGGRVVDIAVGGESPRRIYVAAATGGLWKSTNEGTSWEPVFDHESAQSIGDVTVDPTNADVVWVGSGEVNPRNSVSWGDGVYKSTNGGKTWTNVGLKDTRHIGRIVVDPRNPNTVYVGALGHLWGPNKERGVFKTIDGGQTWTSSLFINARHRRLRSRDGSVRQQHDLRRRVRSAPRRVRGRRSGEGVGTRQRHLQDDGRRADVAQADRGTAAGRPGPHRHRRRRQQSVGALRRRPDADDRAARVGRRGRAASAGRPENDEGRRRVSLGRSRRDVALGERHRQPAVLLQPGAHRSHQREPPVRHGLDRLGIRRRRAHVQESDVEHPRRSPRDVDRSQEFQAHPRRQRRRHRCHLGRRKVVGVPERAGAQPDVFGGRRHAHAVLHLRRRAGLLLVGRSERDAQDDRHPGIRLVQGADRRRFSGPRRSSRLHDRLRRVAERRRRPPRSEERPQYQHQAARALGTAGVPVQLGNAAADLVARFQDDLHRRQLLVQVDQSRRCVDRDQSRADDGQGRNAVDVHGVAARRRRALRGHRRWQRLGDTRWRQ